MSRKSDRHPSDPVPFFAYALYLFIMLSVIGSGAIMWGITQDAGWHGFGGVVHLAGLL